MPNIDLSARTMAAQQAYVAASWRHGQALQGTCDASVVRDLEAAKADFVQALKQEAAAVYSGEQAMPLPRAIPKRACLIARGTARVCVELGVAAGIMYGLPERWVDNSTTLERLVNSRVFMWCGDGMDDIMRALGPDSERLHDERMRQCEKAVARAKKEGMRAPVESPVLEMCEKQPLLLSAGF
jgi:hypothetical protein